MRLHRKMTVHKASIVGLGLFVVALTLVIVTNVLPCFAQFDSDDVLKDLGLTTHGRRNRYERTFGVWSICIKWKYYGEKECEEVVDRATDWLRAVQILMCFGMSFVALAVVCSLGQLYKGSRGCYSKLLGRITCAFGVLGGFMTLIADIIYATKYRTIEGEIHKYFTGESYSMEVANVVEDKHELSWGFWTNLSACVLILAGAVMHLLCRPSSPPNTQGLYLPLQQERFEHSEDKALL